MSRVLAYLGRFAAMILGFIAAALTASITINLLLLAAMDRTAPEFSDALWIATVVNIPVVAGFIGYASFFPALFVMFVAELAALRDWLFHSVGGGMVAFVIMAAHWVLGGLADREPDFMLAAIVVAAGITGGLAYWLIAGRHAGIAIDRQITDSGRSGS